MLFDAVGNPQSTPLVLHKYLQSIQDKETGLDKKVMFLRILEEHCDILNHLIAEYDANMEVEELFEFLSKNHPYKIERIIFQYGECKDMSF